MAKLPATFKQAEVTRVLKGARAAGFDVDKIEVDPQTGRIALYAHNENTPSPGEGDEPNEWDSVHAPQTA